MVSFEPSPVNYCLINFYPDRKSYMPDRFDDEYHIEPEPFIATLSLRFERTCILNVNTAKLTSQV